MFICQNGASADTSERPRRGWGLLEVGRVGGRLQGIWARAARLGRRGDERGNALVEAAIIIPVLMIITFGGIEFGIGFSQQGGLQSVARAGARLAATETDADCIPGAPLCAATVPHTEIGVLTANAVNAALAQTSIPKLTDLYVYQVDSAGNAVGYSGAFGPSSCSGSDCIHFSANAAHNSYDLSSIGGSWPKTDRDACSLNADRVGVTVQGQFQFLTGLVGSGNISLRETAVLQLEPTNCS